MEILFEIARVSFWILELSAMIQIALVSRSEMKC